MIARTGHYGGTYAHKDIAFEFGSWLSPKFKLYLIKEFQRLKDDENDRLKLGWNLQRTLAKINYRIHTDAEGNIRDHAPLEQLVVLTNLESLNSVFIRQDMPQFERLRKLNEIAISQMRTLLTANNIKRLK